MTEKKKRRVGAWLRAVIFVVLLLISLLLIFHNQIANVALKTYEPEVTKTSIKKGAAEKKTATMIGKRLGH